ncbi:hypothetical protein [Henriciella sp.]|uniref:hypothetical protein n=1 Tax=Henriciella sp. TaxID=1968823 RepID=UPI00262B4674|nr:hypothetical protein [Henriciella sp.]
MKKVYLAGLGLFALAACGGGGGDRAAIVNACVEDGSSNQETCECMADAAKENLDDELYSMLADAAREGADGAEEIMSDLDSEQQSQFMKFAMQAGTTCSMGQ